MASIPSCVNNGGPGSQVSLDAVPVLEQECRLSASALQALERWQARTGEILTVVDPERSAYRARIISLKPDKPCCVPFEPLPRPTESPLHITVCQSLPDKERFELVLQKLTEIGVDRIVPMESQRSATQLERDAVQKKSHRWPDVISRAARQCRRAVLPELMATLSFDEAMMACTTAELKLMLYEGDTPWTFREGIGSLKPQSVALLIGPEGGFAAEEVAQAQSLGFLPINIGPRILRTETAAIVAAALVQSYLGDMD